MYRIETTKRFEKDYVLCSKLGYNMDLIDAAIKILSEEGNLPPKYKQHKLSGEYSEHWECHIQPDWLLVWQKHDEFMTLEMIRTGTHSDLFK